MSRGDHIYIQLLSYTHHGIDLGNGTVIEYSRNKGIRLISKKDFSKNQKVYTKQYTWCFSTEETIKKAYSRLGERKYSLLSNNCEHFACWCKTGVDESKQIKKLEQTAYQTTKMTTEVLGNIGGQAIAASAAGAIGGVVTAGIIGGAVGAAAIIAMPIVGGLGVAVSVHELNKRR